MRIDFFYADSVYFFQQLLLLHDSWCHVLGDMVQGEGVERCGGWEEGRGSVRMIRTSAVGHLVVVRNWQFLAWGSESTLIRDKIIQGLQANSSHE